MVNHRFQLKRSKLGLLFQFGIGLVMGLLWYQLFPFYLFLILSGSAALAYFFFMQRSHIRCMEYLEHDLWSFQLEAQDTIQQARLYRVIDHHFYVVLKLQQFPDSVVVWRDQVGETEWKQLKVMAKLL